MATVVVQTGDNFEIINMSEHFPSFCAEELEEAGKSNTLDNNINWLNVWKTGTI